MTDAGQSPPAGPSVCPFVALAEDRDRRADAPAEGNRCYAEKAPRRRDMVYQADYCYSTRFATCSVFLDWAARNAAEPAYVSEAARKAWASGIASPEAGKGSSAAADGGNAAGTGFGTDGDEMSMPDADGALFGPADSSQDAASQRGSEHIAWVSASAWAEAPWDPLAEAEADELEAIAGEASDGEPAPAEEEAATEEEAMQGPKVPAALPMRRRRRPQQPIRTRGSGEWFFADPPEHQPLVRHRGGSVGPPILLAVLGLLVVSIIVFLLPTLLDGGGTDQTAAMPSQSPGSPTRPLATRAPAETAEASSSPSPTPEPELRVYTVRPGDTLSGIAADPRVRSSVRLLQCLNGLTNPNLLQPGQKLLIPPDGYSCPAGWRRGTPSPGASPSLSATLSPGATLAPSATLSGSR